jgi:hypothetical protein
MRRRRTSSITDCETGSHRTQRNDIEREPLLSGNVCDKTSEHDDDEDKREKKGKEVRHFFSDMISTGSNVFFERKDVANWMKQKYEVEPPPEELKDLEPAIEGLSLLFKGMCISRETYVGLSLTLIFYPLRGNQRRFKLAEEWIQRGILPEDFISAMESDIRRHRRPPFSVIPVNDPTDFGNQTECPLCCASLGSVSGCAIVRLNNCVAAKQMHCFHRTCITESVEGMSSRQCPVCSIPVALVL